jgi:hypothetical protein
MENTADKLFKILGTKFSNSKIKTLTSLGKETTSMDEVEMFSFDFIAGSNNYGPVVILTTGNNLEIYYGDNTSRSLDSEAKRKWENFIEHMSTFARSNRLGFSLKHTTDLKYDLSNAADITESFRNIFEGYYGTSKTSYNKQGNAKIIIKHSKQLGEGEARFRNISALFVENADGERFKLPFTKLSGARAMARHVTEGGNPYDLFGLHISEMVRDINTLGGFVRRSAMFEENEDTIGLVETGQRHYTAMRKGLKQIAGKRGYNTYKEGWEPSAITEQDTDVNKIRGLFTERSVNTRIEEALPLLARLQAMAGAADSIDETVDATDFKTGTVPGKSREELLARLRKTKAAVDAMKARKAGATQIELKQAMDEDVEQPELQGASNMKEVNEFAEWAEQVIEGTWSMPDTDDKIAALTDFLAIEQPLGIDALNVTNVLYDIVGDDDLFDSLAVAAAADPESDARPIVISWISDNDPALAHELNYDNTYARDFPRESISNSEVRYMPGRNRDKPVRGGTTPLSPDEKKARYDAWGAQGRAKTKAAGGKTEFDLSMEEGLEQELDADNDTQLTASVNKDLDKYIKKESQMDPFTKYVAEIEDAAEPEPTKLTPESMSLESLSPELGKEIAAGADIYDIMVSSKTSPNDIAILNRRYDIIAGEFGYAPDDDFELILEIMAHQISKIFDGSSPYESVDSASKPSLTMEGTDLDSLMQRTRYLLEK